MSYLNKYRKVLFVFLCLAFVFSVCGEALEAGEHESEGPAEADCCFICHSLHGGLYFESIQKLSFSASIFSKVYSLEKLSLTEAPLSPLFHPPQTLV